MERINGKLLSWASILDWGTREQARKTASMPFIHPHLALMPDAHLGKGATVGSVIPTEGAIMPAAVGVDAGCGMIAWRTDVCRDALDGQNLADVRRGIEQAVPLSPGNYNAEWWHSRGTRARVAELETLTGADSAEQAAPNWRLQLGSLGGGTTSSRYPRTKTAGSGCSCTLVPAG